MVSAVVFEFYVMRCQPLRRALSESGIIYLLKNNMFLYSIASHNCDEVRAQAGACTIG